MTPCKTMEEATKEKASELLMGQDLTPTHPSFLLNGIKI